MRISYLPLRRTDRRDSTAKHPRTHAWQNSSRRADTQSGNPPQRLEKMPISLGKMLREKSQKPQTNQASAAAVRSFATPCQRLLHDTPALPAGAGVRSYAVKAAQFFDYQT
jgi:hypothetical protein